MLDLHRLHLLRELSRRGTITAVARALSFSPSAVSQQLATLERETGVQLLEPVGRRVRLTPRAELLVEHATSLLAEMERAESALAASATEVVGTLRVAAFQSAVLTLVPPALSRLADTCPRLRVEVTELEPDDALPAMAAGEHDLVIAEEYPDAPLPRSPETERIDLLDDELLLVVPAAWAAASLADLADRPWVMEPPDSPAGRWATATCRRAGFEPDVRCTTTNLQIHLRLAEQELAVALVPELSVPSRPAGVHVVRLDERPARRLFVAVRTGSRAHPAIEAFSDELTRAVAGT